MDEKKVFGVDIIPPNEQVDDSNTVQECLLNITFELIDIRMIHLDPHWYAELKTDFKTEKTPNGTYRTKGKYLIKNVEYMKKKVPMIVKIAMRNYAFRWTTPTEEDLKNYYKRVK